MSIKTFFSKQAGKPSGLFGRFVMSRIFDRGNVSLNEFMKDLLSIRDHDHILEIGFGTGKLIADMAQLVKTGVIEGIDVSTTMVALAAKRNKRYIAEGKVILRHGDFEEAAYPDDRFDIICSANTIYFWEHPDHCIQKIWRILKPGGKVILAFEDKAQLERRPLSTDVFHFYTQDDIKHLLSRNGFSCGIDIVSCKIRSQRYHCAVAVK
jgi:ubiquinone/menaquinone biosynthesis C-methylase UbiE